jgi:thiol-disulfide isomerase/thioredoxin
MKNVSLFAVACVLFLFTGKTLAENPFPADWFFGEGEQRAKHDAMIGKPAPTLDLSGWMNGQLDAEAMKGKIVVVDFWATWCGPCIRAIPHNNEMAEKYKDKGVVILGICGSPKGQEKMEQVAKDKGITYPIAKDHNNVSAPAWNVMWWPTYAVVDRKGIVRAVGLKPDYVDEVVEKLLAEDTAQGSTR